MQNNYLFFLFLFISNIYSQNSIINDTFEKDNYNLSINNDNYNVYVEKRGLILENNHDTNSKWSLIDVNRNLEANDFDVEVTMSLEKTNSETSGYGLVWACYNDNSNYHVVSLNEKGQHQAYWHYNKHSYYDLNWTENKNVKSKRENTIKVSKRAQIVTVYVNDEVILKTNKTIYYGDKFGFILAPKMTIKVSNLKITEFPLSIDVIETFDANLKIEKLPETISSKDFSENNPVIAPDGKTLFFERKYCEFNIDDSSKGDVWFSTFENGTWSETQNIGRPINNMGNNFVISVSPDNNSLLLANVYSEDGMSIKGSGLSIAYKNKEGWGIPKEIKIKNFSNKNKYVGYFLANDNKHLLMAIQKEEGFGLKDLYVSFLEKEGSWSTPLNLGNIVNTYSEEANPFLASDGKTLYFSSKGHPGYGGYDLYVTKRLDDSWTNWSKPKNLGNVINSTLDDLSLFLTAKGDKAFVGRGSDLYEIKNTAKQDPVVLVSGKVYDSKTNQIISAPIVYNSLKTNEPLGTALSNPKTGDYSIVLPFGEKYSFMAEKEGYYAVTQNVDLSNLKEYKEITVDLYLNPIQKGQTIRLNNIFFDSGKYDLLPESNAELDKLYKVLLENKHLQIEIAGHTDAVGSDNDNQVLSFNRANAVMNYLLSKGIKQERLTAKGYGEKKFIATNETEEGKRLNRRVEFSIVAM
ncbi:OmpA family protein [Flavobacterium profundi]|nr:OmpA family protein [Flavobacterium profundi]